MRNPESRWWWSNEIIFQSPKETSNDSAAFGRVWSNLIVFKAESARGAIDRAYSHGKLEASAAASIPYRGRPAKWRFIGLTGIGLISGRLAGGAKLDPVRKRLRLSTAKAYVKSDPEVLLQLSQRPERLAHSRKQQLWFCSEIVLCRKLLPSSNPLVEVETSVVIFKARKDSETPMKARAIGTTIAARTSREDGLPENRGWALIGLRWVAESPGLDYVEDDLEGEVMFDESWRRLDRVKSDVVPRGTLLRQLQHQCEPVLL